MADELDFVAKRYGDIEIKAPDQHAVYARFARELLTYSKTFHPDAGDHFDLRFIYSTELFSKLLRRLTPLRTDENFSKTVICVDMPGVYFASTYITCLFGPQRAFSEYLVGAATGTIVAIDNSTVRAGIFNAIEGLENARFACEYARFRDASDVFWNDTFRESIRPLQRNLFGAIGERYPATDLNDLIFSLIMRFTVGHEYGHYLYKTREEHDHWTRVSETAKECLPGEDQSAIDEELFAHICAIEFCLFHDGRAKRKPLVSIVLTILFLELIDFKNLSDKDHRTKANDLKARIFSKYLINQLERSPHFSASEKDHLTVAVMEVSSASSELWARLVDYFPVILTMLRSAIRSRLGDRQIEELAFANHVD